MTPVRTPIRKTPILTAPDPIPTSTAQALRQIALTPWKARNEWSAMWTRPVMKLLFLWCGLQPGVGWRCYGLPILQIHRASRVSIGGRMTLRSTVTSNPLAPTHPVVVSTRRAGANLIIGDDFGMTGGTICAEQSIRIGNRVIVGANSTIIDTDFHPLTAAGRRANPTNGATVPVEIGDDVFIGMNCLILKGAQIGDGAVIGAGSIVTGVIPAGVIAAGNPARVVRSVSD